MTTVPAAQYLRVSTERQEYSLDCQSARIANYAQENGFAVCQTYCDEAKSGLEIGHRTGLSRLLQEVVGGKQSYKAILVYDVSRWLRPSGLIIAFASLPLSLAVGKVFHRACLSKNLPDTCQESPERQDQ